MFLVSHNRPSSGIESLEPRRLFVVPVVVAAQFEFLTAPQRITFQFNTDVSASLATADVRLQNHTMLSRVATSSLALVGYDNTTNTGTFAFPGFPGGVLPDGNYRARLVAGGVSSATGESMTQDAILDFFALSADANRDRSVDIADFGAMAGNFNLPGNFAQGDFNYSGITDISDFSVLAARFNQTLAALAAPTTRYTVTLLPAQASLSGTFHTPYGMNDLGHVVGTTHFNDASDGDEVGFSWRPGDATLTLGGADRATGVSNSGLIVGWNDDVNFCSVQWTQTTVKQPVLLRNLRGNEPGGNDKALGVNNANVTVGTDAFPPGPGPFIPRAVRWPNPTTIQEVGQTMLTAINDNGDMVGDGPKFYPSAGGPAVQIGASNGLAMGINNAQEVVGVIGTFGFGVSREQSPYATSGKPFYWKAGMVDPFMLEFNGESSIQARAINSAGQIVGGRSGLLQVPTGAFIWKDGMPYSLEDMLEPIPGVQVILHGAADINDNGQILAFGDIDPDPIFSVGRRAFLLTPVPSEAERSVSSAGPEVRPDAPDVSLKRAAAAQNVFASRLIEKPDLPRMIEIVG